MRERAPMSAAEVMHRYVAAARSRDVDAAFGMFAEDIVFRIPGRSSHAGRRQGRDEAMAYIKPGGRCRRARRSSSSSSTCS
jgi:ketosteroid isomerase-like protein